MGFQDVLNRPHTIRETGTILPECFLIQTEAEGCDVQSSMRRKTQITTLHDEPYFLRLLSDVQEDEAHGAV